MVYLGERLIPDPHKLKRREREEGGRGREREAGREREGGRERERDGGRERKESSSTSSPGFITFEDLE